MAECRQCKYYEKVPKKRHGYCRRPNGYYEGLKVTGAKKAADRCFEKRAFILHVGKEE